MNKQILIGAIVTVALVIFAVKKSVKPEQSFEAELAQAERDDQTQNQPVLKGKRAFSKAKRVRSQNTAAKMQKHSAANPSVRKSAAAEYASFTYRKPSSIKKSPLKLDPETKENLLDFKDKDTAAREFLLNEVGLNREEYLMVRHQQRQVYLQLAQADYIAKQSGQTPEEVRSRALARHVYWMQSTLGVGYYNKLLELTTVPEEDL